VSAVAKLEQQQLEAFEGSLCTRPRRRNPSDVRISIPRLEKLAEELGQVASARELVEAARASRAVPR
jgi:hypothetical protein